MLQKLAQNDTLHKIIRFSTIAIKVLSKLRKHKSENHFGLSIFKEEACIGILV